MNRHLIRTSVNVIAVRNGKILLSRRLNTGWSDGLLCLPGGHVEAGETPRQAAIRETKEELGLNISHEQLAFCCVAQRKSGEHEYVAYEFVMYLESNEEPVNAEPEICSELVWADPNSLPEDIIPDFRSVVEEGYVGKEAYLELGYL